ncbi:hypothetical protein VNI00_017187 [Paramarasmius palmivorus]|uniref:BHLH domain-containing protein n=1 Tax=Paramarasmius palmivorus TaxID=297713 RepID=A0AAW0B900_9AGAR
MSPASNELYAGSCNPSRKAKQPRASENSIQHNSIPIQPRRIQEVIGDMPQPSVSDSSIPANASLSKTSSTAQPNPTQGPAKRGRKPGTMSRSARETQRKLNHSIIEKARRTKINEALATLKQLVPSDFGSGASSSQKKDDSDSENDDDGEYQEKKTNKKSGKKEEKEREFKLEILIRTVSYMEHLIDKVKELESRLAVDAVESEPCSDLQDTLVSKSHPPTRQASDTTATTVATTKRKRAISDIVDVVGEPEITNRQRRKLHETPSPDIMKDSTSSRPLLPSISAWLPDIDTRSQAPSPNLSASITASPALTFTRSPNITPIAGGSYLPSPPSSTHFTPTNPPNVIQMPPVLTLGPTAEPRQSGMRSRSSTVTTPEEESAASVLVHFRKTKGVSSPTVLPTPGSSVAFVTSPAFRAAGSSNMAEPLDLGPAMMVASRNKEVSEGLVAQTPSSILGLGFRSGGLSGTTR